MTVDKRAKVVSLSSKHEPHQLSIFDFHVLRSQLFQALPASDELYRSSRGKFHALSNSSEAGAVCGHSASSLLLVVCDNRIWVACFRAARRVSMKHSNMLTRCRVRACHP